MTEREATIESIERILNLTHKESINVNIPRVSAEQAVSMLKEQEPILLENQHKPYGISTNANSPWVSRCPRCDKKVEGKQTRFCKYCGQAVKWNEIRKA